MTQQIACETGSNSKAPNPRLQSQSEVQSQHPPAIYSIIPSILQSRISKLSFLHRPFSTCAKSYTHRYRSSNGEVKSEDAQQKATAIRRSSVPVIPERSTPLPPSADERRLVNSDAEDTESSESGDCAFSDRPLSWPTIPPDDTVTKQDNGVIWRYANQGLSLLVRSFQESSILTNASDHSSRFFSRQLYVHALTYLLRGLPDDLSSEEQMSICSALPKPIIQSAQVAVRPSGVTQQNLSYDKFMSRDCNIQPSILHRILATCIIQTFLLLQLLLPYVRLLAYSAYRFERENRLSERMFSSTINTIDEIGKRSLRYTDAVCKLNDGRVGDALTVFVSWWIREIAGGVHEGLIEGMVILGAPKMDCQ